MFKEPHVVAITLFMPRHLLIINFLKPSSFIVMGFRILQFWSFNYEGYFKVLLSKNNSTSNL